MKRIDTTIPILYIVHEFPFFTTCQTLPPSLVLKGNSLFRGCGPRAGFKGEGRV
jgi:hypothetical protein